MLSRLLTALTGKDDLERIAATSDLRALNARLATRPVLVPRRPGRFLDVAAVTEESMLELMRSEAQATANDPFEPWVIELDGVRRLPVFSSPRHMETFVQKISGRLDQVFALGHVELLVADATRDLDVDLVHLNLFSPQSWEIGVRNNRAAE